MKMKEGGGISTRQRSRGRNKNRTVYYFNSFDQVKRKH